MTPTTHPVEVTARPLVTAGRTQLLVDCPFCGGVHRHLETGPRRGPCGSRYAVTTTQKDPTP
ncbi:hypothetical protein [Streptomyces mirabilis]|uniref:Uncharacterized protein n=1 Tax=Streptomyces mirabilis TaxID=68239 RepID=A0ABU3UXI9_9ACTN|nr:hypothetical protein [Streptomyces mirabilis]MDU8998199.1 hypothetical protein [Streptomyces mirabilis]